jgi:hypothetical protein
MRRHELDLFAKLNPMAKHAGLAAGLAWAALAAPPVNAALMLAQRARV